ncbi:MAG: FGGY-family carbohydrate kinase [Balneolales bacterium]
MRNNFFIGCDVGTNSVRAGIFDTAGTMIAAREHPIKTWRPESNFVEQSSDDIWKACRFCFTEVLNDAGLRPSQIKGIGFDATCSLVVLGEKDKPLPVGPENSSEQNIIVWMDHRAIKEAEEINQKNHDVLKFVGGRISPEMQTPKLLWLKKNKPKTWREARKFFDLSDYLVYKATGEDVRSLCTTTCKWTYLGNEKSQFKQSLGKWDDSFFRQIGLDDIVDSGYEQIGNKIRQVGEAVGSGLNKKAAEELGLQVNTPVGVAIIDAHAGGLGLLGMESQNLNGDASTLENRLALIGGTSSCHMVATDSPQYINGIWGPYFSAMIPGMWLNEGGQSATGSLIDHVIFSTKISEELTNEAQKTNKTVYQILNEQLHQLAEKKDLTSAGQLTKDFHVLPYFHGNRSPRANPNLVGSVCGLKLSSTLDDLAVLYLATIQAIAYGTRHIINELNSNGYSIDTIVATGGGTKNEVFLQEHANITRCNIMLPAEPEAVLLGSAILGAAASGEYPTVRDAMKAMSQPGKTIYPRQDEDKKYYNNKYLVFQKMYDDQISYNEIMN